MKLKVYVPVVISIFFFACGETKPISVEIKDVCSQSTGTNVTIQGYLSLPQMLEVTKYLRGGQGTGINYKLFLMTKQNASDADVEVIVSGTSVAEPNKIQMLPTQYTSDDLTVYSDDGKPRIAGDLVKLTGIVQPNNKNSCQVNVSKIENP